MGNKPQDESVDGPKKLSLIYSNASENSGDPTENEADFIKNIEIFKTDLPLINVPKVELAQC